MSGRKEILWLLSGILAAVIVLLSQSGYYYISEKVIHTEYTSDQDLDEGEAGQPDVKFTNDAVTGVSQVHIQMELEFISNLFKQITDEFSNYIAELIPLEDYLEILFQRIISPNAP